MSECLSQIESSQVWTVFCQRLLLEPGLLMRTGDRAGEFPVGEIDRSQVAAIVVAK